MSDAFAEARARDAALTATAQAFDATALGTLDDVEPLAGSDLPALIARQLALTGQRVRVLSAQLARAYAEHGRNALVREDFVYDRETGTAISAGESITALAELEGKERDRLDRQLAAAVRLGLEKQSREEREQLARQVATVARELCEQAGLSWSDEGTRALARRVIVSVFGGA